MIKSVGYNSIVSNIDIVAAFVVDNSTLMTSKLPARLQSAQLIMISC